MRDLDVDFWAVGEADSGELALHGVAGGMIEDYWIVGRAKPASWQPNDGWNRTGIAATLILLVIPVGVFNFNGVIIGFIVYLILEHFWPSESGNN